MTKVDKVTSQDATERHVVPVETVEIYVLRLCAEVQKQIGFLADELRKALRENAELRKMLDTPPNTAKENNTR